MGRITTLLKKIIVFWVVLRGCSWYRGQEYEKQKERIQLETRPEENVGMIQIILPVWEIRIMFLLYVER